MQLTYLTNNLLPYRVTTLAALSRQVERLTLLLTGDECAPGLEHSPIRIECVKSLRLKGSRRHPTGYSEHLDVHVPFGTLSALFREASPNVFAVELGLRTVFAVLWRKLGRDRRLVVHADLSEATERGRGPVRRAVGRALVRHVDYVMVNGTSGARYMRSLGCPDARIGFLPYACDVPRFAQVPDLPQTSATPRPLKLLYVGRLVQVKGLVPFVHRLADAMREHPGLSVEFTLVGRGEDRPQLEGIPLPENLRLEFAGAVDYDDVPSHYARSDVVVMPSLGDTWGLSVSEAMASGRPVLGSIGAQAVEELVFDGITGWRFDTAQPDTIDAALSRMLASTVSERATIGRNARRAAAALSPEQVALRIVNAFRGLRGLPEVSTSSTPESSGSARSPASHAVV